MAQKKFAAQADEKLIKDIRQLAKKEGKYLSTLMNEAFEDLIEKRKLGKPRRAILEEFEASLNEYASLYEKLAK
jgi:mRNA-degrading endonuclease RelE of RelBE toxin-antitoxin system